VNRLSIGVQSLDEQRLRFLGRLHDPRGGLEAIAAARRAGAARVSADLIFGVAGQLPEQAAAEALRIAETGITHLSAYALTIESNTQFGALAQRGKLPLLDDGLVAESFTQVASTLEQAGFEHYEVSNYARSGHQALHNLGYWRGDDYLGLGVGAWGTVQLPGGARLRYRNTASVETYMRLWTDAPPAEPFAPGPHLSQHEPIEPATALSEKILLGLRLAEGLDLEGAAEELDVPAWPPARARSRDKLLAQGRLENWGGRLRIPKRHWLFADGIIAELL
jgi:oxygen-independent coproporphyrinogen-3 oxidase